MQKYILPPAKYVGTVTVLVASGAPSRMPTSAPNGEPEADGDVG